jgi:2-polyprenyl-3-methyl-5-hydroxy-6-metoxy-1,4-benzoquinol methylase
VTPDLHYTDPRLARLYDQDCGWGPDSAFYLALAGYGPLDILDLGCGTGILSNAYAEMGHRVTGVDPAAAMLAVARTKPQADRISWVTSSAQAFRSDRRFDLIVMTGHAFQVLLTDAEISATFLVMRDHLAPGGRIVFETRNPEIDWADRWNGATRDHLLDGQTVRQTYHVRTASAARIAFDTGYAFPDVSLTSTSTLRFSTLQTILTLLAAAGLRVQSVFGDWNSGPYDNLTSEEMIFTAST